MMYYGVKLENNTLFTAESQDKTKMKAQDFDITENKEEFQRRCDYYRRHMISDD